MMQRNIRWIVAVAIAFAVTAIPPAAAQPEPPKKYALLIGLNQYLSPRVPDLKYATKDVTDLLPLLVLNGYVPIGPLLDVNAGRDNVVAHLYRIAALAKSQDSFLLYFAGHGVRSTIGRAPTYWLTYDATFEKLDVDGIRLNHLLDYVADIKAGQKIVLLDHCFSGDIVVRAASTGDPSRDATAGPAIDLVPVARGGTPIPSFQDMAAVAGSGTLVIAAARGFAYELDSNTGGNGVLTTALLNALKTRAADSNSDAKLSANELMAYVESEVWRLSNEKQQPQRPQIFMSQGMNPNSWIIADKLQLDTTEARRKASGYIETLTDWWNKGYIVYTDLQSAGSMLDTWVKSFANGRQLTTTEGIAMRSFETVMADSSTPADLRGPIATALIKAFHRQ
jgi:hypothetical protein